MEPKLITDDAALRRHVPNLMNTVEGEPSFFDRCLAGLISAEEWLKSNILGDDLWHRLCGAEEGALLARARNFVALMGFRLSLGGLDLVITPNGCGVISNSNIAPASKERVAALAKSLLMREWVCIEQLFKELERDETWLNGPIADEFGSSMIYSPVLIRSILHETDPNFDRFLELRSKAAEIEQELKGGWFGEEFYKIMTRSLQRGRAVPPARGVQSLVVTTLLQGGVINTRHADDLVDYIRLHPEGCAEWHASEVAKLFSPPVFKNRMDSGGYFF